MTVIIFLIVLALLIFVHELGHFIFARLAGIRVDEFAIGFGPKIFSKKVGETKYALNLIPFGGYVKIFGENPDDESISGPDRERSFVHKAKWKQVAVLFAGILFNFIFAFILIALSFMSGVLASRDSYTQYADRMENPHIAVTYVNPGSPAEKAGLKAGDTLVAQSVEEIQNLISQSEGKPINLEIIRDNERSTLSVVAEEGIVEDKYAIGISMDNVATLKLGFWGAIKEGFKFTISAIWATAVGLYNLVAGIFDGSSNLSSVTGPVGIAGLIGDAAQLGFTYLLMFTAIISINLGVLNLVPFPALDGGRILFVLIEAVIRRPIKPVVANTINTIGFFLLITLMVVVTYRDIAKLFVN